MSKRFGQYLAGQIEQTHAALIEWQRAEVAEAEAEGREAVICPVSLLWVALAEQMGLTIDLSTGRLSGGPDEVLSC